jgi:hypothetical protein
LGSPAGRLTWSVPVTDAKCMFGRDHAAPAAECSCGLYAHHRADPNWRGTVTSQRTAYGAVLAFGRILRHGGLGFRAQRARVLALAVTREAAIKSIFCLSCPCTAFWEAEMEALEVLANRCGVPLIPISELERFSLGYGQSIETLGP